MTDGLIQQAFKKYIKMYEYYYDNAKDSPYTHYQGVTKNLEGLQQELIEKIKQESDEYVIDGTGMDSELVKAIMLRKLIGDNQEWYLENYMI